jgi:hypothetical protein
MLVKKQISSIEGAFKTCLPFPQHSDTSTWVRDPGLPAEIIYYLSTNSTLKNRGRYPSYPRAEQTRLEDCQTWAKPMWCLLQWGPILIKSLHCLLKSPVKEFLSTLSPIATYVSDQQSLDYNTLKQETEGK